MSNQNNVQELTIPEKLSLFVDKKSGATTFALPTNLPDGTNAALMVTRIQKGDWNPGELIKKITIEYHNDN